MADLRLTHAAVSAAHTLASNDAPRAAARLLRLSHLRQQSNPPLEPKSPNSPELRMSRERQFLLGCDPGYTVRQALRPSQPALSLGERR